MTMHICHPSLSTTGKKRGKKKFRNSEAAQRARQQKEEWNELKQRWGCEDTKTKPTKTATKPYVPPTHPNFKRRDASQATEPAKWDPCTKNPDRVYTGDKVLGVTVVHKSCLQPVFSKQEAVDAAKMRR